MEKRSLPRGVPVLDVPPGASWGGGDKRPRPYEALTDLIAPVGDPWRDFDRPRHAGEIRIARWLRMAGVEVRSVGPDDRPTPDAVIPADHVTVEFKALASGSADPAGALYQRLRHARNQSRRVVADVRGSGATRADVNAAVRRVLRNGGLDLDEVAVVGDGFVVSWP